MTQTDLFARADIPLPDETELMRRFTSINASLFSSRLPAAEIRWSTRMRIAGTCDHRHRAIRLSRPYHEHFPADVDDTLKHEMIHLLHPTHSAAFRAEADRIGASVHCQEYPGLHPRARLTYVCPHCRTVYHRMRRERLYCGRCARARLDERFALVLRPAARRSEIPKPVTKPRHRPSAPRPRNPRHRRRTTSGDLFS
jgi:predicted SprT family Zn-dependent metalloprotease